MNDNERSVDFLKYIVEKIYNIFKRIEFLVYEHFPVITPILPEKITFVHSEELAQMYPSLTPRERETEVAKKYGAVFVIGIGSVMPNGEIHDGRAPDYDDWTTPNSLGQKGLNGDIILWNPVLEQSFEISSMGIRVNKESLLEQLTIRNASQRKELYWHSLLLDNKLPQTIGGGIGQSRLCMFFLRKAHIGEIQSSIWPEKMIEECNANNIFLL